MGILRIDLIIVFLRKNIVVSNRHQIKIEEGVAF